MVAQQSRKLPHRKGTGVRISYPPQILSRDVPGRAACFQTKRMGFESSSRRQGRARQMVSQHTANVPSAQARLGSIPRLSAKFVGKKVRVSGGYGWPRLPVEQSAPLERPGSNPGTPTTRPRSPTGRGNRLKIGEVWVRIPAGPPLAAPGPSYARLLPPAIANAPNRPGTKSATTRFQSGSNICANDRHRSWSLCGRVMR